MRTAPSPDPPAQAVRRPATLALGFALGGFFDGIVLHQVLQWHHLLSAVDAPGLADPRAQVLADGLFHAAMYVVAVSAIVSLLRPGPRPGGLRTAGLVLLGFAAWHATDAVLSHWLLGLHRIRMGVASPLAWDLGWLLAFGALPALLGARWARIGRGVRAGPGVPIAWAAVATAAALVAARPPAADGAEGARGTDPSDPAGPAGTRTVAAVLAHAGHAGRLLAALPDDARVIGADDAGRVWWVRMPADASALRLLGHGAIWVAGTAATPGCAAWAVPRPR